MRQSFLAALLIVPLLASPTAAREQALGFSVGLTGTGTHYRILLDNGWGYGGSFSTWSAQHELAYTLGGEVLHGLSENPYGRLYWVGGLGVSQPQLPMYAPAVWAASSGLGIQLGRSPGVTLSFEGQLSVVGNGSLGWSVVPAPSLALLYYF